MGLYDDPVYQERLSYEIGVIKRMGFSSYFLFVKDVVDTAREKGILVGPGRGSAAGSLVSYVLSITQLDPIKYGLLFERFLNPERVSPPDIDIDFEDEKREYLIEEIRKKYGYENTAKIITFSYLGARMALRDALRAYGVSPKDTNDFMDFIETLLENDDNIDVLIDNEAVKTFIKDNGWNLELFMNALQLAKFLVGKPRQPSIHAAGLIVAPHSLMGKIPLATLKEQKEKEGREIVTQFDMKILERMGYLKIDILGLAYLTTIRKTLELIKQEDKTDIDIYNLSPTEQDVFEIFRNGSTTGIFQFESEGMRSYLRKLAPDCMHDLIAMNALYRPGPLKYIDVYIDRKHGREEPVYIIPQLKSVLEETYGVLVYQEQIMEAVKLIANYTLAEADLIRRAIGKKIKEIIDNTKKDFIERAVKNNIPKEKAIEIFEMIEKFADYGFNKSHAAAYSYLAYLTAYLKAKYKHYYYASLFNINLNDHERIIFLIKEAQSEGIKIEPPNVNSSNYEFTAKKEKDIWTLHYGLGALKGIKEKAVEKIIDERNKNGAYKNLEDFLHRVNDTTVDKKTLEVLLQSGALDELIEKSGFKREIILHQNNKKTILDYRDKIREKTKRDKQDFKTNLFSLFQDSKLFETENEEKIDIEINQSITPHECAILEKEVTGAVLSGYSSLSEQLEKIKSVLNSEMIHTSLENVKGEEGFIIAFIEKIEEKVSKKNTIYYEAKCIIESEDVYFFVNNKAYKMIMQKYTGKNLYLLHIQTPTESFDRYVLRDIYRLEEIKNDTKVQQQIKKQLAKLEKNVETKNEISTQQNMKWGSLSKEEKERIKEAVMDKKENFDYSRLEYRDVVQSALKSSSTDDKNKALAFVDLFYVDSKERIKSYFQREALDYFSFIQFCLDLLEDLERENKADYQVANKIYIVAFQTFLAFYESMEGRLDGSKAAYMLELLNKIDKKRAEMWL